MPDYRKITNLIFEPKGIHDPTKTYTIKDTVTSSDRSKVYFAIKDVPAGIPLTNTNYWILQIDLSASKNAMDTAAANARTQTDATIASANTRVEDMMGKAADAVTSVADYAAKVGMRVKGETKITKGNPMTIYPDGGSLLKVQTDIPINQSGSGDPYPEGGGKNLCPPIIKAPNTYNKVTWTPKYDASGNLLGYETSGTASGSTNITHLNFFEVPAGTYIVSGAPSGSVRGNGDIVVQNEAYEAIARSFDDSTIDTFTLAAPTKIRTVCQFSSGTVADGNIFKPMIRLASDTDATYAPPSNIRPIIGYDKLNLNRAGKNLIPYYNFLSGYSDGGVTVTINADKTLTFSGTATRDAYFYLSIYSSTYTTGYVFPPGEYTLSGCPAGGGTQSYRMALSLYKDGVWQEGGCTDYGSGGRFTIPEGHKVDLYIRFPSGANANGVTFKPMIRLASIADDTYEPYQNTTYTVQLGQTVYGGRFDWLTGKLIVTHKYVEYGRDTVFYSPNTGLINNGEIIRVTPLLNPVGHSKWGEQEVFSNLLPHVEGGWSNSYTSGPHLYILNDYPDTLALLLPTSIYGTTEASVKAKLAETPLQVVYKLATPIEMQLAPNVITATEDGGMNHIYGDGDLTVEWIPPLSSINKRVESLLNEFSDEAEASGNPLVIKPVGSFPFDSIVTEFGLKQSGSGDPYPAGGGKNLIPSLSESVTTNGITFTPRADGKVEVNGTLTDTGKGAVAYLMQGVELPAGTYTLSGSDDPAAPITIAIERNSGTVDYYNADSGIAHTFDLAAGDRVSAYVQVYNFREFGGNAIIAPQIERGSVATEFEKHENIRPFIGYDALELNQVGKNLIGDWVQGAVSSKGEEFSSSTVTRSAITKIDEKNVYVTVPESLGYFLIEYADGVFLTRTDRNTSQAFTLRDNTTHIRLCLVRNDGSNITPTEAVGYQVEYGSVGTEVKPYQGKLYTVQIGQTVYGGRFDWLTGKLVADYRLITLDGTEGGWRRSESGRFSSYNALKNLHSEDVHCSHYRTVKNSEYIDQTIIAYKGDTVYFTDNRFADTAEFAAYLAAQYAAGTPVQVIYKLATPIEIQLPATEIIALTGVNTLYGDGDTITAKFRQSKDVDILKRLSALETLMTNQTKGE